MKKILSLSLGILIISLFILPAFVVAQDSSAVNLLNVGTQNVGISVQAVPGSPTSGKSNSTGIVPCDGSLSNPCNFNSVFKLVNTAIQWFLDISIAIAAITFMVAGGKMLANPSNPGKREEAVEMFKKTTIGIIIVLMAWLVIHTILATFTDINVTGIFLK